MIRRIRTKKKKKKEKMKSHETPLPEIQLTRRLGEMAKVSLIQSLKVGQYRNDLAKQTLLALKISDFLRHEAFACDDR
jgi:hypothetical protein